MDFLVIEINDPGVQEALNRLGAAVEDLSPALDAIGMEMENRVAARFETKTDPNGIPWAPWKPSTVKSYPKDGNHQLLNRYGDMLASLNHQLEASTQSVLWGFGQPYATFHETGTGKMERRGMLTADPEAGTLGAGDQEAALEILNGFLRSAIEG